MIRAEQALVATGVLGDDFPRRPAHTHETWAALDERARSGVDDLARLARERLADDGPLLAAIAELGAEGDGAVALLARLATELPVPAWRVAATHALRDVGTPAARGALVALLDQADPHVLGRALAAIFDLDPVAAFDRLSPYFDAPSLAAPGGASVPRAVLHTFAPSSFRYQAGREIAVWAEPEAPAWFAADPRWLALAVRLRRDEALGPAAREVLRHAPAELVHPALDAAAAQRASVVRARASGDRLARYLAGEHQAVWTELRALGPLGDDAREEALAVARATMTRFAANADALAARLGALGWQARSGVLRRPPVDGTETALRTIEAATGAVLPASLRAYWEVVGLVDFVWDYELADEDEAPELDLPPELTHLELDPLGLSDAVDGASQLEEWQEEHEGQHPELVEPFVVALAPDRFHKANISGGDPYGVALPTDVADPLFGDGELQAPLVEYLRTACRTGGFPGLAAYATHPAVVAFVTRMTRGLEPF